MSTNPRYYLGPVARVEIKRESAQETGCVTAGCSAFHRHGGGKFCSLCGAAFGEYEVPDRSEVVDHLELFDGEEALTSCVSGDNKHRLFTPNVGREGVELRYFDNGDVDDEVFAPATIDAELAGFVRAFAAEIDELRTAYGDVEIVWMLFSEWI